MTENSMQSNTMDEPPSGQRAALSPLLTSTNTLTQHCRQVTGNGLICEEHRLIGQPESLKAFCDLFSGKYDDRIIWVTKKAFVFLGWNNWFPIPEDFGDYDFILSLRDTDKHEHCLSIHASTLEESILCLEYLVELKDTHFEEMEITVKNDEGARRLCLFGADTLEKMIQNSARRISFHRMIFTPDHCRTLASSGTKTNIQFYWCEFQDLGAAFVEASAARQYGTSGPAKLSFVGINPFNDRNWALFLSQHKLESLELSNMSCDSEVSCRAVATAGVRCLTLGADFELEDGGAALVEAVKQGRGPQELCFDCDPFHSPQSLVTFVSALRGNTNLERLELPLIDDRQVKQALTAALRENTGLVHLAVYFDESDCTKSDTTELL
jgi:hypothetical protein